MTDHLKSRTQRYAVVILRSLCTAALVFVSAMSAGVYVTNHVLAKVYAATAVMEVQPEPANPDEETGWAFSSPQSRAVEAEFESIESPEVLKTVIATLGLDREWAARVYRQSEPLAPEDAVRHLKMNLWVHFKHGTNVVEVRATSDDPQEAANIANAVVTSYEGLREREARAATRPVQIRAAAVIPEEPSRPNKRICYAITAGVAGLLSVLIASSVEVCLLIARAEESAGQLAPAH